MSEINGNKKCIICKVRNFDIIFLPCGHLITCLSCALNIVECPVLHCGRIVRRRVLLDVSDSSSAESE